MVLRMKKHKKITSHQRQKLFWRGTYGVVALLVAVASVVALLPVPQANADEYDDRIAALQQDIARYQGEADRLNSQAVSLATAVAQLANEKAAIQAQIDLNQVQYDQLVQQIIDTEKRIQENRDALGVTIADLYVNGKTSPLEMLASSKNVSDYLNQQEYRTGIRDQLTDTIKEINKLKKELDEKKSSVEKVLNDQKAARDTLAAKEAEQQAVLNQTRNDEATYQSLIGSSQAQINEARATQALIRARLNSNGGYVLVDMGSLTDYPWNASNCPMWGYLSTGGANGNGGDGRGYGCRQCASYVAWRIAKETGMYPSWGNAKDFDNRAIAAGFQGLGMNPQPGSIAVMEPASAGQSYGHVAWVEAVNGDKVLVSQYNYDYGQGYGMYSQMWLSKYAFDSYVKIK